MRGWGGGGGGSATAPDCHFLIRPGSTSHSRVFSAFSIAMVFITHDISFPAQLLKPAAPTHLPHIVRQGALAVNRDQKPPAPTPALAPKAALVLQPPLLPPQGPDHSTAEDRCERVEKRGTNHPHPPSCSPTRTTSSSPLAPLPQHRAFPLLSH